VDGIAQKVRHIWAGEGRELLASKDTNLRASCLRYNAYRTRKPS